ncbi:hypothetical protein, conserved [Eimeria praecox]|uniref:Uncharacterized protein n=1 Tax=Eimeria praecox TaxID=51316 RepID=U6G595_9EIME|nr:hypothetical protein, conserved [Eimeria praecox]
MGPSLQLLVALPMHHQLQQLQLQQQQQHQRQQHQEKEQQTQSEMDGCILSSDRADLTNKLQQLLDKLIAILPFAASWEQRVGASSSFFSEDRTVPEAAADLLTTATDEVYKAFSGTFWRLACRHVLSRPRHSKAAATASPRVGVLSDLAALISTGFSTWLRCRWQPVQQQELQQEKQKERDGEEGNTENVEAALDKLLQRTACVPLKSPCETFAFALFVLQQITLDFARHEEIACNSTACGPAQLLMYIRLIQVLVGHTRSLRNSLEVLDAEQQSNIESLATNCFKSTSELLQTQERCLDRLAVYALFPGKEDRQTCSGLLDVREANSTVHQESDVGHFVLRITQALTQKDNAFTTSPASEHVTTQCKAWNALLEAAESIEEFIILRLLSGKHVTDNANLCWKGHPSPLMMLMAWDAQLHVAAVKRLQATHPISGAPNKHSHPGSIFHPGLHHHVVLTHANSDSPVFPDMLQLAHAFAVACLLLLTGRACAFASSTFFPFVVELLDDDLWEEEICRETHTTNAAVYGSSGFREPTTLCWVQYIQSFLLKWWIRGSGEARASPTQKRSIRQNVAENEVSMFQVVAYLTTFILPPRGVRKNAEISHYLSCIDPPISCPPDSGRDDDRRWPKVDGNYDIFMDKMKLSVSSGQPTFTSCSQSCEIFLGFVPEQLPPSTQRYLAQQFVTPHLPKAYIKDLGTFLLRASTAMRQQLSVEF